MKFNRRSIKTITGPSGDAVTMAQMLSFLHVDPGDDEEMIKSFIDAAVERAKTFMRRALLTETLELTLDGFPGVDDDALDRIGGGVHQVPLSYFTSGAGEIDLPFPPIQSVASITTYDAAGTASVLDAAAYDLDETGGRVYLKSGYSWPSNLRTREAVRVRFVAGYGAGNIPAPILLAIKQYVSAMYDCRMGCDLPDGVRKAFLDYQIKDGLAW